MRLDGFFPMDTKVRLFSNGLGIKHGTLDSGAVLQRNWHQTWKMSRNQAIRAKNLEPKKWVVEKTDHVG